MIQRIQSLYLIMTTLIPFLFLKGSILKFGNPEGSEFVVRFRGFYEVTGEKGFEIIERMLPLSLVLMSIPLLSVLSVFLFRKRRLQLKITYTLIIMIIHLIVLSVYYGFSVIRDYQLSLIPVFGMFIPFLLLIFSVLAYRSIKRDEDLVKSYERLR